MFTGSFYAFLQLTFCKSFILKSSSIHGTLQRRCREVPGPPRPPPPAARGGRGRSETLTPEQDATRAHPCNRRRSRVTPDQCHDGLGAPPAPHPPAPPPPASAGLFPGPAPSSRGELRLPGTRRPGRAPCSARTVAKPPPPPQGTVSPAACERVTLRATRGLVPQKRRPRVARPARAQPATAITHAHRCFGRAFLQNASCQAQTPVG